MRKVVVGLAIFVFAFLAVSFAETEIKAEADKTSITTDDTLIYKIIITSSDKAVPAPQLPEFTGFGVLSQAQSSTMSYVKSNVKTILVYAFVLAPTEAGKFEIGPSTIKIGNKTYSTQALEIEVKPGKTKPKTHLEEPSLPEKSLPESQEAQVTL